MAAFRRGSLYVPPLMQCRHRGKINIAKPETHFERMVFEAITKPILPKMMEDPSKLCSRMRPELLIEKDQLENEFEQFLLRRCKETFERYSMIIFMQPLSMKGQEKRAVKNKLINAGLDLLYHKNEIIRKTIEGTKFQNLEPLVYGHNCLVVSEDTKLPQLVKTIKKIPQLSIMGGIVENRIMSNADIMHYASLPDLDSVRGQLASLLSAPSSRTHGALSSHQQTLLYNLTQHATTHPQS